MSSLGRHLTTPAPHGELSFHPACPVCCDTRLHGNVPDGAIVPAGVKASLATALVTVSTAGAAPSASIAQEVDEQMEGIELPQPRPQDAPDPGDETRVPDDQSVPVPNVDGGDADDDSEGLAIEAEPDTPPPPEEPAGAAPPGPPEHLGAHAPPPAAPPPASDPVAPEADERKPEPSHRRGEARTRTPARLSAPTTSAPVPPPVPATLAVPPASEAGQDTAPGSAPRDAPTGSGQRVVRPGESLWSIAADLAGHNATAGEIARLVNRLWTLNADRIGTGNPDLVMAGTKLRVR